MREAAKESLTGHVERMGESGWPSVEDKDKGETRKIIMRSCRH